MRTWLLQMSARARFRTGYRIVPCGLVDQRQDGLSAACEIITGCEGEDGEKGDAQAVVTRRKQNCSRRESWALTCS